MAKHFLPKCTDVDQLENIEVHLTKQVEEDDHSQEVGSGRRRWS